jgi:hypothetical protein
MDARTWFTPKQKAELWERWKSGQGVADIDRSLPPIHRGIGVAGCTTIAETEKATLAAADPASSNDGIRLQLIRTFPQDCLWRPWRSWQPCHCKL